MGLIWKIKTCIIVSGGRISSCSELHDDKHKSSKTCKTIFFLDKIINNTTLLCITVFTVNNSFSDACFAFLMFSLEESFTHVQHFNYIQ